MKIIEIKGREYRALKDGEVILKDDKFNDGSGPYEYDVGMMRGTENSARIADYAYYRLIKTPAKKAKPWGSFRLKGTAVKGVDAWGLLHANGKLSPIAFEYKREWGKMENYGNKIIRVTITPKAKKS